MSSLVLPAKHIIGTTLSRAVTANPDWTYVFVYGTLKKGFLNHVYLQKALSRDDALFVGHARTRTKFPLVIRGERFVPSLLPFPGLGHQVKGEVYKVNHETLAILDELEGVSRGYYERLNVDLEPLHSAPVQATRLPSSPSSTLARSSAPSAPEHATERSFSSLSPAEHSSKPPCYSYFYSRSESESLLHLPHLDDYQDKRYIPRVRTTPIL